MATLKRPLEDDISESPTKKLRFEDLKSNLDALLAVATEHHEEARLTAVDSAYDLEESWKDSEDKKNATATELETLEGKRDVCAQYISDMKSSSAFKMLQNVSKTEVNGIEKLTQDHQKLKDSMEKLESLCSDLETQIQTCAARLEKETKVAEDLKKKHEEAEEKAQEIAGFNETD